MTDSNATLQKMADRANDLYSLPAVAIEVLELTNNPQVDASALKRCIEADPALTAKLLRVVNSSLYGLSREVSDLNQALALLGTKPLKLLVLGFSLPPGMFAGLAGDVLKRYWRHTLIKAVAARELAEKWSPASGDEAFIAGLLQDIGVLVLVQELGSPYVSFVDRVLAGGADLVDLEARSLGFDHTMLTSRLLSQWNLPASLVKAVLSNGADQVPTADISSAPSLPRLLQMAGLVSRFLADGEPQLLGDLLAAGEEYCCLNARQLEEMLAGLKEKVVQLADVLAIDVAEDADYSGLLAEAHRRLAEVAAEVAGDMARQNHFQNTPESETEALLADLEVLAELITSVPDNSNRPPATQGVSPPPPESTRTPGPQAHQDLKSNAPPVVTETASERNPRNATSATIPADPGTLGQLAVVVAACRRNRCSLSLMLAELDGVDDLAVVCGVDGMESVRRLLETACRGLDHACTICLPHGEAGFAVILPNCDRSSAIDLGHQLLDRVNHLSTHVLAPTATTIGVSIGVATLSLPPKNFPPDDLFKGAARCLYGSHASGGGVLKSIEIY